MLRSLLLVSLLALPAFEMVGLYVVYRMLVGVLGPLAALACLLAILSASAAAGALLIRYQGGAVIESFREAVERARARLENPDCGDGDLDDHPGGKPRTPIVTRAAIMLAGLLLVVPGFLTDVMAVALLVPPIRTRIGQALFGWLRREHAAGRIVLNLDISGTFVGSARRRPVAPDGSMIETVAERVDDTPAPRKGPQIPDHT